jgi:hypothetical protein
MEYEALKSYAKDSLDYRAGLRLKADHLFLDSLSLSLSADIGNVTGSGMVTAYKLESSYLSFSGTRVTMLQGGVEAERDHVWKSRFTGFWISFYQDRSLATGRGINYSLSASGILVDPIREETTQRIMYVDDVKKTNPVHYRDPGFQDTLPGKGISTFVQYTSNTGLDTAGAMSPQSLLTLLPTLGYSIPLPLAFSAEAGCHYILTFYPHAYRWTEAPLPQGFAEASGDFQGLALNQADGGRYAATLIRQNGGFQEHYGAEPESETSRLRIDNQVGLELSLRRRWAEWGAVALNGVAKRNWSTVAGIAPIWIPKWDMGAELKWSGSWNWI